jgi:SAM-dependent methyltransferase
MRKSVMTTREHRVACDVCSGRSALPAFGELLRCTDCGFVFFNVQDETALRGLYGKSYFTGDEYPDYLGEERALRQSMRRHLWQMARLIPLQGRLLEIGCAYGLFMDEAKLHFDMIRGIDVCAPAVEYAQTALNLDASVGDVTTMDLGDERYDVICMWDTIEHLARPSATLRRCADLLRPEGHLFLTTGDIGSVSARLRGRAWRQIHPPTHVSYFDKRTMRLLLARVGFDVIRLESAAYFHTVSNILGSLRIRGSLAGVVSQLILRVTGPVSARRLGFWINLGDIMFVAARLKAV